MTTGDANYRKHGESWNHQTIHGSRTKDPARPEMKRQEAEEIMDAEKQKKLEADGWTVGDAEDFVGPTVTDAQIEAILSLTCFPPTVTQDGQWEGAEVQHGTTETLGAEIRKILATKGA